MFVSGHSTIEFPTFLNVLAKIVKDTDPETELTEAFKVPGFIDLLNGISSLFTLCMCIAQVQCVPSFKTSRSRRVRSDLLRQSNMPDML